MTIVIADGRGALWQWDTGRRVKIVGGADVKQIHYQNQCFGRSVDVDVEDDGTAIIPDELLQDYHRLTAYAYVTDDTGAYTMVQQDFAVYKRAKPADYVYTPTERAGFDKLRDEIGDLADLTTKAKENLVAAINEAAASGGSGSMNLRVADGYIQYSTDSGSTWQNLIALAELKGAGMDITGATVGQIAKITAVDASGVPTAWSPADMPSGGSTDAVLYTAQTLTDAQKKQARDNIDAAVADFVINATVNSDMTVTLDKTYTQIKEAIAAGKKPIAVIPGAYMPFQGDGGEYLSFSTASVSALDDYGVEMATLLVYPKQNAKFRTSELLSTKPDGTMPQVDMSTDPVSDMQIATKKYVDDSVAGAGGSSVPKPLTYDYMPEGYPKKTIGTVTVMGEQELAFAVEEGTYVARPNEAPEIVEGQTYIVTWDGADYECVCSVYFSTILALGNKSIYGAGDDTGEPFLYLSIGTFATLSTSASHTISVKTTAETATPMAVEFLPVASEANYGVVKKSEIVTPYKFDTSAPHDLMVNAITEFRECRASISWSGKLVAAAEHDPSTDKIVLCFAGNPYEVDTFENLDGYYIRTTGVASYTELVTNAVRLLDMNTNNNNAYCLLKAEGTPSDMAFEITANRLRLNGFEKLTQKELYLESSTTGSTKKFKITVDDGGTISATEVT